MQNYDGRRLYSASDLVNFLGCPHASTLDVRQLTEPVDFPDDDAQTKLLQEKGLAHERDYLESLRAQGRSIVEVADAGSVKDRAARTLAAMCSGVDVVYQGALLSDPWHGYSDFLLKTDGASALGEWAYDVADTKLSRSAKPSHVLQLCVYADLLASAQGAAPKMLHVVLGGGGKASLRPSSVQHYYAIAKRRFEGFAAQPGSGSAAVRFNMKISRLQSDIVIAARPQDKSRCIDGGGLARVIWPDKNIQTTAQFEREGAFRAEAPKS